MIFNDFLGINGEGSALPRSSLQEPAFALRKALLLEALLLEGVDQGHEHYLYSQLWSCLQYNYIYYVICIGVYSVYIYIHYLCYSLPSRLYIYIYIYYIQYFIYTYIYVHYTYVFGFVSSAALAQQVLQLLAQPMEEVHRLPLVFLTAVRDPQRARGRLETENSNGESPSPVMLDAD